MEGCYLVRGMWAATSGYYVRLLTAACQGLSKECFLYVLLKCCGAVRRAAGHASILSNIDFKSAKPPDISAR